MGHLRVFEGRATADGRVEGGGGALARGAGRDPLSEPALVGRRRRRALGRAPRPEGRPGTPGRRRTPHAPGPPGRRRTRRGGPLAIRDVAPRAPAKGAAPVDVDGLLRAAQVMVRGPAQRAAGLEVAAAAAAPPRLSDLLALSLQIRLEGLRGGVGDLDAQGQGRGHAAIVITGDLRVDGALVDVGAGRAEGGLVPDVVCEEQEGRLLDGDQVVASHLRISTKGRERVSQRMQQDIAADATDKDDA